MSAKDEILEPMAELPDGLTVDEALQQLQPIYNVQQGLGETERREPVSHDAAKQMIDK